MTNPDSDTRKAHEEAVRKALEVRAALWPEWKGTREIGPTAVVFASAISDPVGAVQAHTLMTSGTEGDSLDTPKEQVEHVVKSLAAAHAILHTALHACQDAIAKGAKALAEFADKDFPDAREVFEKIALKEVVIIHEIGSLLETLEELNITRMEEASADPSQTGLEA